MIVLRATVNTRARASALRLGPAYVIRDSYCVGEPHTTAAPFNLIRDRRSAQPAAGNPKDHGDLMCTQRNAKQRRYGPNLNSEASMGCDATDKCHHFMAINLKEQPAL